MDSEPIAALVDEMDFMPMKNVSKLNLDSIQCKVYNEYISLCDGLFDFYQKYGNRLFCEEDTQAFAWFTVLLVDDENFYGIVEGYFKNVNDIFNELVRSSSEQKLRIRGVDVLLGLYAATLATAEELNATPHTIYDTMSDLLI